MNEREHGEKIQELMKEMHGGEGDSLNSLVIRLMHRYGSLNFGKFQRLGLHPGQLPVLVVLRGHEGISLREMADMLHIKPPTVTVTIQRLERIGLVCKRSDAKDQRINRLYLTDKGRQLGEEIQLLVQEDEEILRRGFSEEELRLLKELLHRMLENLAQASAAEPCPGKF